MHLSLLASLASSERVCLYSGPDMHSVRVQKVISRSSQITPANHRSSCTAVLRRRKAGMHGKRRVITLVFLPLMGSDTGPEGPRNQASARNDQHSCATVTHAASEHQLQRLAWICVILIVRRQAKHVVKWLWFCFGHQSTSQHGTVIVCLNLCSFWEWEHITQPVHLGICLICNWVTDSFAQISSRLIGHTALDINMRCEMNVLLPL